MIGIVREMASMKRRKFWKTGKDGLCCSSSAIQTRLGPSSLLEERSEIPIVLLFLLLSATPQTGGNSQGIRLIMKDICLYSLPTFIIATCVNVFSAKRIFVRKKKVF